MVIVIIINRQTNITPRIICSHKIARRNLLILSSSININKLIIIAITLISHNLMDNLSIAITKIVATVKNIITKIILIIKHIKISIE